MKFLVQVICVPEAVERREQVFEMEREHLTMETLGSASGKTRRCYGECKSSWWPSNQRSGKNDSKDPSPNVKYRYVAAGSAVIGPSNEGGARGYWESLRSTVHFGRLPSWCSLEPLDRPNPRLQKRPRP